MQRNRNTIKRERLEIIEKIRDIKETFHAKMGTIKDRNSMDLTEEDIKKRWQEYTEELYNYTKKIFMTQITTWCDHSPRVRNSGGYSHVGLRKHHYEQS